jgi:hypothetical protein
MRAPEGMGHLRPSGAKTAVRSCAIPLPCNSLGYRLTKQCDGGFYPQRWQRGGVSDSGALVPRAVRILMVQLPLTQTRHYRLLIRNFEYQRGSLNAKNP